MTPYVTSLILSIMTHCSSVAVAPNAYSDCEFDTALVLNILTQEKMRPMHLRWELEALEFSTRCPSGGWDRKTETLYCSR